jgi:hypothetical protein
MRFLTLLLLLLVPSISLAAPTVSSVSGSTSDGQQITILGTGFGSKSTAAPLVWETFEQGTLGNTIISDGFWDAERDGSKTLFSDKNKRHDRSYLNALHTVDNIKLDSFQKVFNELNSNGSKLLVSFWLRIDFVSGFDRSSSQLKVMRLTNNGSYNDSPILLWQSFSDDNKTMNESYTTATKSDGTYLVGSLGRGTSVNGGMPKISENQWVNVQITYQNSTSPTNVKFLVSPNPGSSLYQGSAYYNVPTLTSSSGPYLNTVKFGYHQNDGTLAYNHWDDIYIDNSWSRVEIGDNPVYGKCTHREMQIPSTWSSGQIAFKLNQGAFSNGATAYLFVIDENGVPSPGYPITLGTNIITGQKPSPPSNLRIVN